MNWTALTQGDGEFMLNAGGNPSPAHLATWACMSRRRLRAWPFQLEVEMARPAGLEPATSWFVARRSIQLS